VTASSSARRLAVLCNPTAGGGRGFKALDAVRAKLSGSGLEARVVRTESHEHAVACAREAAESGEQVVAFGGDGMVRIVAHVVRGTGSVMGLLPGGRGNDFARSLEIPLDPVAACEVLIDGAVRSIDAGDADGETFVGVASVGLESEVTRIANDAPRFIGSGVYLYSTFLGLARWKPATFELVLDDGSPHTFTGYMAGAANSGRFGGGMRFAPDARLDDGLLDVVVIEDGPKLKFVTGSRKVFKGTHIHEPGVHVMRAREVRMSADRPFEVYADGDPIARTPAVVKVVPGALRILAPAAPPI
jgi:YegS/Rv2252/BmrU family lipid kinase